MKQKFKPIGLMLLGFSIVIGFALVLIQFDILKLQPKPEEEPDNCFVNNIVLAARQLPFLEFQNKTCKTSITCKDFFSTDCYANEIDCVPCSKCGNYSWCYKVSLTWNVTTDECIEAVYRCKHG